MTGLTGRTSIAKGLFDGGLIAAGGNLAQVVRSRDEILGKFINLILVLEKFRFYAGLDVADISIGPRSE